MRFYRKRGDYGCCKDQGSETLEIFHCRAPEPGRLRSLWAGGSAWSWRNYDEIPTTYGGFMTESKSLVFRFGDMEIREREFCLVKAGAVSPIEPKAFRVLLFLLRNPQKLITKEELLDAVWADASVTESSLTRSIAKLRRALGDDIREPRYIATVATVGYRFIGKVEVSEEPSEVRENTETPPGLSGAGKKVQSRRQLRGWA